MSVTPQTAPPPRQTVQKQSATAQRARVEGSFVFARASTASNSDGVTGVTEIRPFFTIAMEASVLCDLSAANETGSASAFIAAISTQSQSPFGAPASRTASPSTFATPTTAFSFPE